VNPVLAIALAVIVLALDIATKWLVLTRMAEWQEIPIIPGFFSLQFVYNPGAAFGMLAHQQWLFIGVSAVAILAILAYLRRPEAREGLMPWGLGLLLGGAVGNLIDRLRWGKVVDFFLFYWRDYHFPNFNVADIGITVGVGLFILHLLLTGESERREGV
jgi:signal peptidase II